MRSWLASVRLFWGLLILNLFAALATATVSYHKFGGDYYTYIGYADGLLHSRYSYWYFFPDYLPDTFRNPGYPLFLAALKATGLENNGIRLIQMTLYGIIVWLLLRLARRCESDSSWLVRNLFLLLLLPNVQLAYFAADIVPELLVAFLVTIYATVALDWPLGTWRRTVALALLAGLIFQVRPVFVLFPVVQLALDFWRTRPRTAFSWVQAVALLVLFSATMLPYALWNYRHHGVLKPTSLEGGAGVMQIGFWAFRMSGYREHHYWGNQMGEEPVSFVDPSKVPGYIADFNHEWKVIEAQCRPLLTARDH